MSKKKEETKELVVKEPNALAIEEMKDDADGGFEDMGMDDVALPFLGIIQSLSPQRSKNSSSYIEGAEEGTIFNNVSEQLFDGVCLVPCAYQKIFIEWVPRDKGGGLVGIYDRVTVDAHIAERDGVKLTSAEGNNIVPTMQYFCVLLDDAGNAADKVIISMSISQIKVGKKWNSKMQSIKIDGKTPSMYRQIWSLTSIEERNSQNQQYFNWATEYGGVLEDVETFDICKRFHDEVVRGNAKVEYTPDSGDVGEDDMPF